MPNYSQAFRAQLEGINDNDTEIALLTVTHPDLVSPIRVCNDNQDITSGGNLFVAAGFYLTLPDDKDQSTPRARLAIDNTGRELMQWLEQAEGGSGAQVRIQIIRKSAPNTVEQDLTVGLQNLDVDLSFVSGELGYEDVMSKPCVGLRYDPVVSPGLF